MLNKITYFFNSFTFSKAALLLSLIGLIVFANSLFNQLFWDDYDSIVNNAYIRDWSNIGRYFSENLTAGSGITDNYWRPLLLFSFSIDYHIEKLSPFIYHLDSLFWHILSACLVYLVIFKLFQNKPTSFISAVIFLVHPLQVEAVTYAAGRADPMHTALMLSAFLFFYKYVNEKLGDKWYFWSLAFFAGALLVKERAIIFPALLAVYFLTLYGEPVFKNWKSKIIITLPYFGIALIYLILRMTVLHFTSTFDLGQPNNIGAENWYFKILAYFKGIAIYAGLLVWPARLYMEKSISLPRSLFDFQVIGGIIIVLVSIIGTIISFKRKRIFAFGMLWFWIALSPSIQIYPIQGLLYEHWLYFPLIGLLIALIVPAVTKIQEKNLKIVKALAIATLILTVSALGVRTIIRNADWNNPIKFYEKNITLSGVSARVYTNLGMALSDAKQHEKAIETYQKAINLDDRLFQPWYDMGNDYQEIGKSEEAVKAYQKAIKLNPQFFPAYYNVAAMHLEKKDFDKAIDILNEALIINEDDTRTLYNIGIVYIQKGEKEKAREYLTKALKLDPHNLDLMRIVDSL